MSVSPISAIHGSTPLRKTAKAAKVSKRDVTATGADPDEKQRKPAKQAAKDAKRDFQAAPKPAAAMSSSAVQAALTFLKSGG